ncbi:MAG: hypothetical protein WCO23_05355 [bacterium]
MLEVDIENILPLNEIKENFEKISDIVAGSDEMYIATENGWPKIVITGVHHLEKLTGRPVSEIMPTPDEDESVDEEAPKEMTQEEKTAESLRLRDKVLAEAMEPSDEDESDELADLPPEAAAATKEAYNNIDNFVGESAQAALAATKQPDQIEFGTYGQANDLPAKSDDISPLPYPTIPTNDQPFAADNNAGTSDNQTLPTTEPAAGPNVPDLSNIYPSTPNTSDDDQFEILSTTPADSSQMSPNDKFDALLGQSAAPVTPPAPQPTTNWTNQPLATDPFAAPAVNPMPTPPPPMPATPSDPAPQASPQVYTQNSQE